MTTYEIVQYENEFPSFREADPDEGTLLLGVALDTVAGKADQEPTLLHTYEAETYEKAHAYWKKWVTDNYMKERGLVWGGPVAPVDGFAKGINREVPEG